MNAISREYVVPLGAQPTQGCSIMTTHARLPMERDELHRKIYHMLGGMLTPTLYLFLERGLLLPLSAFFMVSVLGFEIVRLSFPAFQAWVRATIPIQFKENEERGLSGQAWMQVGYFLVILLFPRELAILSMCFIALGDPVAALVGKRFGRRRIPGTSKSVEGSLACLAVCLMVGVALGAIILGAPLVVIFAGVVSATLFELFTFRVDDNFLIPVGSCLTMWGVLFLV
jgi:dolichol kinase